MIKQKQSISLAKAKIIGYTEKLLEVEVNMGRNKFVTYQGKISNIYPAIFTVVPSDGFSGKTCFSYQEYSCGIVKLKELNK